MNNALGLIEVVGLAVAINTADVMLKAASVTLLKVEKAKGSGWMTIFVTGDVGAVNASIESGVASAKAENKYVSSKVIARPGEGIETLIISVTKDKEPEEPEEPEEAEVTAQKEEVIEADDASKQDENTETTKQPKKIVASNTTTKTTAPRHQATPKKTNTTKAVGDSQ